MTSDYRFWASGDVGWMVSWRSSQAEKVTSTSLVQKGTIQLLVGLDHSREPVLDDTVASNWEADRFVDSFRRNFSTSKLVRLLLSCCQSPVRSPLRNFLHQDVSIVAGINRRSRTIFALKCERFGQALMRF
jgi:hypothetical protein